jgi:hypothetical protein
VKYEQTQVEEQECHEDDLRNEFTDDVNLSPEKSMVPQADHYSDNDRHFHLVSIQKLNLIFSHLES